MEDYQKKDFAKILKSNSLSGRRWMRKTNSTCVRIYDRNLEAILCTVELYDKYAKVVDYSEPPMEEKEAGEVLDIVSRMVYIELDKIIFQRRKKREGLEQHSLLSREPLPVSVLENGLVFKVDLQSHIDTGLFLDQANTRDLVRSMSSDLRVLNLFSYTGAFSVYAAAGGAASVTSVDMSNTYTSWAKENLEANGFLSEKQYPCLAQDAASFVLKALEAKETYDLIIFDPPSFSNSHKMNRPFDIKKDYFAWCAALNGLLSENGVLILSVNLSSFVLEKGKLKQGFKIKEITNEVRAFGFVSGKAGQVRVWLMEKVGKLPLSKSKIMREVKDEDLEGLVLSMEEDRKGEEKDRSKKKRDSEEPRRAERNDYRRDGDRYERNYGRRRGENYRREGERRVRRDYARRDDERAGARDYSRRDTDRREARDYSRGDFDRSYREDDDRSYSNGSRRYYYDRRDGYRDERRDYYRSDDRRGGYRGDRRDSYRGERRDDYRQDGYRDERRDGYRGDFSAVRREEAKNYNKDKRESYRYDMRNRSSVKPDYERRERKSAVKPYGYDDIQKSRNRKDEE